ncbi:MAG: sulfotransferase [Myxococcota bacterium]
MTSGRTESFVASEAQYHEAAQQATGLDDFGDEGYLEGLRVLLVAYDENPRLSRQGRRNVEGQIVRILRNRLRAEEAWKRYPSVLQHEIRRPIVITGMVRTGSTALHYLMGQDPGIQKLEYWLSAYPQPRPPRDEWEAHEHYRSAQKRIDALYAADPSVEAIHFMQADWPEECGHLLQQSFTDDCFEATATIPSYVAWYSGNHHLETYRRHRRLIQLIGSTDPKRRWLLKYPVHLRHFRALLEVYPDACVVQTHRDPRDVLSSYCSFLARIRAIHEEEVDREAITREQMEVWARACDDALVLRERLDPCQLYDLSMDEFLEDPVGSVEKIYDHFGQELSQRGRRAIEDWNERNPQHRRGEHVHSKRETGVAEREIVERFGGYMDHFGMKR